VTPMRESDAKALQPSARDRVVWDADPTGFGVRVRPSGVKTFLVFYRNRDGRQRKVSLGRVGIRPIKEARAEARRILADVAAGKDPAEARQKEREAWTLEDAATYFFQTYPTRKKLSPRYLADCRNLWKTNIPAKWKRRKVAAFTRDDIARLHADLSRTPIRANRTLAFLSRLFSLASEQGERPDNPAKGIERYHESGRTNFLTLDELQQVLDALDADTDKQAAHIIRLITLSGARLSEVLTMQWDHLDLRSERGYWHRPAGHLKQRRSDVQPLSAPAADLLRDLQKTRSNSPYVFTAPGDPETHRKDIRACWNRVQRKAGIKASIHTLRHTYASHLIMDGVPIAVISKLLGHSSQNITERYAHLAPDATRAATEAFADRLGKRG